MIPGLHPLAKKRRTVLTKENNSDKKRIPIGAHPEPKHKLSTPFVYHQDIKKAPTVK